MHVSEMLEAVKDNPSGLFVVVASFENEEQDDTLDFWTVADGLEEARAVSLGLQLEDNYYSGGVYVCIDSAIFPTLEEELRRNE
jgi:hypothetical protein